MPPDCIKVGSVNDVLEIKEAFCLRPSPVHLEGGLGGSCNFATRGIYPKVLSREAPVKIFITQVSMQQGLLCQVVDLDVQMLLDSA